MQKRELHALKVQAASLAFASLSVMFILLESFKSIRINKKTEIYELHDLVFRAQNCLNEARLFEALAIYNTAILNYKTFPTLYIKRAKVHAKIGKYVEAFNDLDKLFGLDPVCKEAHKLLAKIYIRFGLYESAKQHSKFLGEGRYSVETKIKQLEVLFSRAMNYFVSTEDAIELLEEVMTKGSDLSLTILASRAENFLEIDKFVACQEALREIDSLEERIPQQLSSGEFIIQRTRSRLRKLKLKRY